MAPANIRGTLAMDRCGTLAMGCRRVLAMNGGGALAMNTLSVLSMHRCLARPVSVAHEPAEVQPVIARNFTPALPALMQRDNIVEAPASCVRQQMRVLQAAPAKAGRRPLRLQCFDRNSGCSRHSFQISRASRNCADH